jgi:tetratricopeptide (TPR) repeat protein
LSNRRELRLWFVVLAALVMWWPAPVHATVSVKGVATDEQVCDPLADYFLGMEDYPEAIRRHRIVIQREPSNALAHYHLGFAYGLMGEHRRELSEYQKAVNLGLSDWQLFLNLGLLYLEQGQLRDATEVLRLATLLGPDHPETHFNLALAYERRGMLEQAEQQTLLSLQIDPDQPDARNTLGAIYAEEGKYMRANEEWTELVAANPNYAPARANLNILDRVERGQLKGAKPQGAFAHEP